MNRSGLTLVEVLVAILFIGVVFLVLANSQILNLRVTRDSQMASISTQVANRAIERASQMVIADFATYLSCNGGAGCSGTFNNLVRGYGATYILTGFDDNSDRAGLIRIDVTVTEPTAVTMSHYLTCMDANPNPTIVDPDPCPWAGG